MKRTLLVAAAVLSACGPATSKYEQLQQPVTPTGTIYVRVLDGNTLAPLPGVAAKVVGGDKDNASLTSGADGIVELKNAVVLSNYLIILESAGYIRQLVNMQLNGTTGNSPLQNPVTSTTVTMVKGDGEIKGVLLLPDGKPAANATVWVDQRNSGAGESVVSSTTGADGTFDLKGLGSRTTGMTHTVIAQWFDENADGQPDFGAFAQSVNVYTGSVARIFMRYGALNQQVIATNIADAELPPGEDIKFTFAYPILPSNLNGSAGTAFTLTDLSRNANVAVEATYASDGVNVAIKPAGGTQLVTGDQYQIAGSVTLASGGSSNAGTNFNLAYTFQVRPANATAITTQVTNFTVTNPNVSSSQSATQFNYNSNSFLLAWDGVPGIITYRIFAKDTNLNPGFLSLGTVNNGAARVQTTVSLPQSFDQYSFDGTVQPLGNKNKVTFTVVPVDFYGNWSPLSSAPTATVQDNLPPTTSNSNLSVVSQLGLNYPQSSYVDAINDDTVASTIQLRVSYSEPMDPTSQPTFTGASVITASWVWDGSSSGSTSGVMTLTIPPGNDGSGPFVIRGGKDMAGNVLISNDITGSLSGMKELLAAGSGSFEDATGNCTMAGWTVSHTSSMPDPVSVPGAARVGKCGGFLGAGAGSAPATGASKIQQDVTLPSIPSGTNWSIIFKGAYRYVYTSPATGYPSLSQTCRLTDNADNNLGALFSNTNANSTNYTQTSGYWSTSVSGNIYRVVCEANNSSTTSNVNGGLYVDDLSLLLFKQGTI